MHFTTLSSAAILLATASAQQAYLSERDADPSLKSFWNTVKQDVGQFGSGFKAGLNSRELLESRDPKIYWEATPTNAEEGIGKMAGSIGRGTAKEAAFAALARRDPSFYSFAKGIGSDISAWKNGFKTGNSKRNLDARSSKSTMSKISTDINKRIKAGYKAWGTIDGAPVKSFVGKRSLDDEDLMARDFDFHTRDGNDDLETRSFKSTMSKIGTDINKGIQAGYKAWGTIDGAAAKSFLGRSIDGDELDARDAEFQSLEDFAQFYNTHYNNPHLAQRSFEDHGDLHERGTDATFEELNAREAGKWGNFATTVEKDIGKLTGSIGKDLFKSKIGLGRREEEDVLARKLYIRALFEEEDD